jgi:hypothetical protein
MISVNIGEDLEEAMALGLYIVFQNRAIGSHNLSLVSKET